jgi:multidrug transporter EmrE-like cation transporter
MNMMWNLIFMVVCAGVAGAILGKKDRAPTDNITLALNAIAVLTNVYVVAQALVQIPK